MFNITKVNKQLRASHFLSWYREENTDYICGGYFAIKTDLRKEENRKILGFLVEKFGVIPETNKGLQFSYTSKGPAMTSLYNKPDWMIAITERKTEIIEDTKLIKIDNKDKIRIFKGEDYIYINMKYFEVVKEDLFIRCEGGRKLEPISVIGEEDLLLILPIRMPNDNKYLKKDSPGLPSQKSQ